MGTVAHRILDDLLFVDIHTDARTLNRVEVAAFCLVVAGEHCLDLVFQLDVLLNGGIMQMDVQVGIHRHPDGCLLYTSCTDGQAPSKADKKLLAIFSGNYKQDYQNTRTGTESFDLYLRLLMVTDYISGMTDSYARTLYRELSGIE